MRETQMPTIRQDCLDSLRLQPDSAQRLTQHRIAVIGGIGFVGTWIAETLSALNDKLGVGLVWICWDAPAVYE